MTGREDTEPLCGHAPAPATPWASTEQAVADLLDFEAAHPRQDSHKEVEIRAELQMDPARYYMLLGRAIDTDAAAEYAPILTRQLRERRRRNLESRAPLLRRD
ncbi:DUF3263 domain-containing protein [Microbacterium sp. G2-8]|uniref:DUF3263 domain-containing protein n=1 Tax=Microbacterium sp. G2-8 TaxID=2842454 RepID=UPI001C8A4421|nr:DUF3263 domain-containing protein [Microbacterium sp. G2-8]